MSAYDPYLKHKIFGAMGLTAVILMFGNAFLLGGKSGGMDHVEEARLRQGHMKNLAASLRDRIKYCESDLLGKAVGKEGANEAREEGLLQPENDILRAAVQGQLQVLVDCERQVAEEKDRPTDPDSDVNKVIARLKFENLQLQQHKDSITDEKKEAAALRRKYVRALRWENGELRALLQEKYKSENMSDDMYNLLRGAKPGHRRSGKGILERITGLKEMRAQRLKGGATASTNGTQAKRPARGAAPDSAEGAAPPPKRRQGNSAACRDDNNDCAGWAEDGECKNNLAFMRKHCPKACRLC